MSTTCIELDGAEGEGGGQILRSSLALSLLTCKPFHLFNVRARRDRPGLQPQHLMSVRAAAAVGQATVRGDARGSRELWFEPGTITPGKYHFPIGTAGATGLVLHTIYLPLMLGATAPSEVLLEGGTHNDFSPCFHFLDVTWRPYLELLGLHLKLRLRRPGFYPRGGGAVEAHLQPAARIRGLELTEPIAVTAIDGLSAVASLPEDIAARQARQAMKRLRDTGLKVHVREESWESGPGTVMALTLDTTPVPTLFFALGARGKRAERVADEAVEQVRAYLAAPAGAVDAHSADQLALPLALADGPSNYRVAAVTQHLLTNVAVIRRFVERDIAIEGDLHRPGLVRIGPAKAGPHFFQKNP
jgi:RNA 3'-terminal phosphate cyclase (ATP)